MQKNCLDLFVLLKGPLWFTCGTRDNNKTRIMHKRKCSILRDHPLNHCQKTMSLVKYTVVLTDGTVNCFVWLLTKKFDHGGRMCKWLKHSLTKPVQTFLFYPRNLFDVHMVQEALKLLDIFYCSRHKHVIE